MKTRRYMLLALIMLLVLLQAGCTEWTAQDKAFVRSLVNEWLESKNMRPTDDEGNPNIMGGIRLGLAMAGQSGDPEADAVCGMYTSLSGVIAADKAMDAARQNGNAEAMDEVIASRPHDWTYRSSRAVLALAQGDIDLYLQQTEEATALMRGQGVPADREARQIIKDYSVISVPNTGRQCVHKYIDLVSAYSTLYATTGEVRYKELMEDAKHWQAACQSESD